MKHLIINMIMFFFISLVLTHILFCFVFLITFKFIDVDNLFIYLFSSCYITSFLICIILIKTNKDIEELVSDIKNQYVGYSQNDIKMDVNIFYEYDKKLKEIKYGKLDYKDENYIEEKHIENLIEYLKHPNINICPVTKDSRRPNDKNYCYICLGFLNLRIIGDSIFYCPCQQLQGTKAIQLTKEKLKTENDKLKFAIKTFNQIKSEDKER